MKPHNVIGPPRNPGKFIVDHPILILMAFAGLAAVALGSGRMSGIDYPASIFVQAAYFYTISCFLMLLLSGATASSAAMAFRRKAAPQGAGNQPGNRSPSGRKGSRVSYRWGWIWGSAAASVVLARIFFASIFTQDAWLDFHLVSLVLLAILLMALAPCLLYEAMIALSACLIIAFPAAFVLHIWVINQGFAPLHIAASSSLPIMGWFLCGICMLFANFMLYWSMISSPGPELLAQELLTMSGDADDEQPIGNNAGISAPKKADKTQNTCHPPRLLAAHIVNTTAPTGLFVIFAGLVISRSELPGGLSPGGTGVPLLLPLIMLLGLSLAGYSMATLTHRSLGYRNIQRSLLSNDKKRSLNMHKIVIGIARHISPKIHSALLLCMIVLFATILFEALLQIDPDIAKRAPAGKGVHSPTAGITGLALVTGLVKFCIVMIVIPALALFSFKSPRLAAAIGVMFLISQLLNEVLINRLLPTDISTVKIGNVISEIIILVLITQLSLIWHTIRAGRRSARGTIIESMRRYGSVYLSSLALILAMINIFVLVDARHEIWATSLYLQIIFGGASVFLLAPSVLFVLDRPLFWRNPA